MTTTTGTTTTTRATGESGTLRLVVEVRGGRSVLARSEGHIPYAARVTESTPQSLRTLIVQTVAGPLAEDRAMIEVDVREGATLELATNAATLAYPAASPARQELRVRLARDARFSWLPEPLILAAGCNLESSIELELSAGSAALAREIVILGRAGEQAGRFRSHLRCELERQPLLHDGIDLDADGLMQTSGAVLAGSRAFASLALLGLDPPDEALPGELSLAGPGSVTRARAPDLVALRALIGPAEARYRATMNRP
jgi:urease accessory protein